MSKCPRCKSELFEHFKINKKGYTYIDYFTCPMCDKKWNYDEVVYMGKENVGKNVLRNIVI